MNDSDLSQSPMAGAGTEETMTALFGQMVLQQTQMALMFLGKVPHPESGQTVTELDAAHMFIGQLEMLEAKTKGNLTKQEEALLKQSLATVRMAFVEAVEKPAAAADKKAEPAPTPESGVEPGQAAAAPESAVAGAEEESRKKFTKKY